MKAIKKEDLQLVVACLSDKSYDEGTFDALLERFGDDYFVGDSRQLEPTHTNEEMEEVRAKACWNHVFCATPRNTTISGELLCPACAKTVYKLVGIREPKYCQNCGARIRKKKEREQ